LAHFLSSDTSSALTELGHLFRTRDLVTSATGMVHGTTGRWGQQVLVRQAKRGMGLRTF